MFKKSNDIMIINTYIADTPSKREKLIFMS